MPCSSSKFCVSLLLFAGLTACRSLGGAHDDGSSVKGVAGPEKPTFVGTVTAGTLYSKASGKGLWLAEITDQLAFAGGQLAGLGGLGDLGRAEVHVVDAKPFGDGLTVVTYSAVFPVAWATGQVAPPAIALLLPRGGDRSARQAFFNAFRAQCTEPGADDLALRIFWYHYRPNLPACPLSGDQYDRSLVSRAQLQLSPGKAQDFGW